MFRRIFILVILATWILIGLRILGVDFSSDGDDQAVLFCHDCKTITVTRIIDGDTFDSTEGRIRLYGVDTPERGEQCFIEAAERLRQLAGSSVRDRPLDTD